MFVIARLAAGLQRANRSFPQNIVQEEEEEEVKKKKERGRQDFPIFVFS